MPVPPPLPFSPRSPPRARVVLAACAPLLLAACVTPLQPVADFGGAANHLADVYKPFTAGIAATCEQREHYEALTLPGPFDDAAAQRDAERKCAEVRKEAATAALFAKALSGYATALVKLSGTKPTAFDGDIKDITTTAKDIETRDATPFFDAHKLGAASKIARAAVAMVLEVKTQRLERATLEQNQDALATVVDAMKVYAGADYVGELKHTQGIMAGELERLKAASAAPTLSDVEARLPWRWAQVGMRNDIAANELEQRRAQNFAKTADALLAAHAALIANFDKLDGAKKLALVAEFVQQVQAFDDEVAAL
jgi:hypothetical protein